jgi:hypothetical protein
LGIFYTKLIYFPQFLDCSSYALDAATAMDCLICWFGGIILAHLRDMRGRGKRMKKGDPDTGGSASIIDFE